MSISSIGSYQEGEEWIARLESDAIILERDVVASYGVLSEIGTNSLQYSLERTKETIEEIKLEMMLFSGEQE